METTQVELSVIVVSYNVRELLAACLRSVYDTCSELTIKLIVVDNASSDGSAQMVRHDFPQITLIENTTNDGFARANNQGFAVSNGEYILLLNPDTIVKPSAVRTVVEFMKNDSNAGLATCRILNVDGTLQRSLRPYPSVTEQILRALFLDRVMYSEYRTDTYNKKEPFTVGFPTGCFMMVRRSALAGQPLLDEDFFMYSEEKDLALRLRKNGFKNYFVPGAEVIHYGGQSTNQMELPMFLELQRSQAIFYRKHYRGLHKWAMFWSWWLVLASNTLVSVPLALLGKNKRLMLFWNAMIAFPKFVKRANYQ